MRQMHKVEERYEGFWKGNYKVSDRIFLLSSYGTVQTGALCTCF